MTPRRRIQGREEWPEGLHKKKIDGVDRYYYRYQNGKTTYFKAGTAFIDAYQAVVAFNKKYRSDEVLLKSQGDKFNKPIHEWALIIQKRIFAEEELGKNATGTLKNNIKKLIQLHGHILSKEYGPDEATDFLNHFCVKPGKSKNVYNRTLSFLNKFFDYLLDERGIENHPSRIKKFKTLKRSEKQKQKSDLSIDEYKKIYDAAPTWLKVAMGLCLQSTHVVNELYRLKLKINKPREGVCGCVWFDEPETVQNMHSTIKVYGTMYIHRHKSQYKKTSFVAIPITKEIKDCIDLSLTDGLVCPYVVRRVPKRFNKIAEQCDHRFQITSHNISREFSKVRDEVGVQSNLPKEKRATFHEIRRIAAQQLESRTNDLSSRMAHANKEITKTYTDKNEITWTEVSPISVSI